MSRAQTVSSFTALALAPGVLKTTMPASEQRSMGMLLVPAPARAMASRLSGSSASSISAERTRMPAGSAQSSETAYLALSSFSRPMGEILFRVLMLYMSQFSLSNLRIKSHRASTPSTGMAL